MRLHHALLPAAVLVFIAGCQTGPSETDKKMVKNLEEIKMELAVINKKLTAIKKEVEYTPPPSSSNTGFVRRGPDMRRLRKIKLQEHPTEDQIRDYIQRIINVSKGQNSYSSNDPQVGMLLKVGSENVELLLPYMQNYYAQQAVINLVKEKDKDKVLKLLKKYPQLITCVVRHNWLKDARQTIFNTMRINNGYLSHEWINAAALLATPKEYDLLKKFFIRGYNSEMTYKAICRLKGFNMAEAVTEGWKYQKMSINPWQKRQMAIIAARFGHKDALDYLVDSYRSEMNSHFVNQIRTALYQLTDQTLSPSQMYKWYNANKDKLVYDKENQMYVLKGKK